MYEKSFYVHAVFETCAKCKNPKADLLISCMPNTKYSGCISLGKSKIGFLNPKESQNGFWDFGNRRIHSTSFDAPGSEKSSIDLFSIET